MCFLHRTAAPVDNRKHHHSHSRVLRPCPPQEIRSVTVIRKPEYGKGACLHHRHRMKQRRHRRRGNARLRQPRVKRTDCRLYAKSHKRNHVNQKQGIGFSSDFRRIQHTSEDKIRGTSIYNDKNQPDKRKRRTAQRIIQVLTACQYCFPRQCMHHKRYRY